MAKPEVGAWPPAAEVARPLLKGLQPVAGLWFPAEGGDPAAQARRLIFAWRPGSSAWRFARGDLLRYPAALEQPCEALAGWPLRQEGQGLCSAFLRGDERSRLPAADVWLVLGGEVLALHLAQAVPLDPADWLDLQGPALHDTYDCREALPPPVVLAPPARPVREVLGDAVPPASAEQRAFLHALARRQQTGGPQRGPGGVAALVSRVRRPGALALAVLALGLAFGLAVDGWQGLLQLLACVAVGLLLRAAWRVLRPTGAISGAGEPARPRAAAATGRQRAAAALAPMAGAPGRDFAAVALAGAAAGRLPAAHAAHVRRRPAGRRAAPRHPAGQRGRVAGPGLWRAGPACPT